MRLAIVAIAACLLIPAAGPVAAVSTAAELRAGQATDFSAAKKKKAAKKTAKKASQKPRTKTEQYLRAVPAK